MPLAAYCKKCKTEVPVGEACALCGGKLTKASVRFSFSYRHVRWSDWNCWNSLLRVGGPVWLLIVVVAAAMEVAANGWDALGRLVTSPTAAMLAGAAVFSAVLAGMWLAAAGSETQYYFLDSKGVNLSTYLDKPGKIQLLLRGVSRKRMEGIGSDDVYGLYIGDRQLLWSDIKRVQIWHDKNRILLYAPAWWMQMAVNCPANEFDAAVAYVIQKLGKRKDVKIKHTPETCDISAMD